MKKTLKELFDFFPDVNYITRDSLGNVYLYKSKPEFDDEYEVYSGRDYHFICSHGFLQVDFGILETRLNVCVARGIGNV
jgi:hypothetical protein